MSPEQLQPHPTLFMDAVEAGVRVRAVIRPEHVGSGLTRAALRGVPVIPAADLIAGLEHARTEVLAGPSRSLVWVQDNSIDRAAHGAGPFSEEALAAIAQADRRVEDLARRTPDATIIVTSGHGIVSVSENIDLGSDPALTEGVRVLAGEPRSRIVAVEEGQIAAVEERLSEFLGDDFLVVRTTDAVEAELWGASPRKDIVEMLGDLVVIAVGDRAIIHSDWDPLAWQLPGHHGSWTDNESLVPVVELRG